MHALKRICDDPQSKFYIVSLKLTDLKTVEIAQDLDWAMLVAYNRGKMERIKGTSLYEKYRHFSKDTDVLVGHIVDESMFYVLDLFFLGNITDLALMKSLSALRLGKQYVARTQKGCDAVRIEKESPISDLEKIFKREK
jgi:hypothetical protein